MFREFCGIVLKGGQLIHGTKAADVRTDIVRGTEQIAHVEQRRRAGAAPWVTATPATEAEVRNKAFPSASSSGCVA